MGVESKPPARKEMAKKFKPSVQAGDVVLVSKMGKRRVNQVVTVGKVKDYADGTYSFYYRGNDGYNLRVWSKVAKFHRIGSQKVNSLAVTVYDFS